MYPRRNALETSALISCGGTFVSVILHYITNLSPLTGIWFPIYIFVVFAVSVSVSFDFFQWLLPLNKPLQYDLEELIKEYPYSGYWTKYLARFHRRKKKEVHDYDTNELSVITTVLERKLVSSWYVPYISQEIGFPFACKQMLDQMVGKTFQICNKIEPKDVYVDICSILISHLKEYRKALKRHEISPTSSIESLYKKSHPISNPDNKLESADHCTNVLRVILKELVPWELWDTPHSELLVRVLSKKLDTYVNNTIADPAWLNDKLLTLLKDKNKSQVDPEKTEVENLKEDMKEEIINMEEVILIPETKSEKPTVESALSTLITKTTAPILHRAINEDLPEEQNMETESIQNIVEELPVTTSDPLDIKSSPILRQRRGRQGRNEVKIYDRIIEGSVKTWETDIDLQCISLGQDLLASLDGEITLSRLWGQDADAEGSPNPPKRKSPQPLWFGEEDAIEMELADSPQKEPSPVRKELSPKPADALLKDLQTTVHQAKTKIGDLQVPRKLSIDVPCKQFSGDEAAGMMEGLLDFGIAGFKKGLRFTGLSDDTQEKSLLHREKGGSGEKISPPEIASKVNPEPKEMVTSTVIQKEENGNSTAPLLIKQQRVISQDSVPSVAKSFGREAPLPLGPLPDSPEPEYEEAADLSTSIAKLRCLLQQRADASPRAEEVWWEGAAEQRGRAQRLPSERPVDTAALADEYDMNSERSVSPGQTSNNMQRLDKLFQRTVTGVFNSLKTAVGAEEAGGAGGAPRPLHDWVYVTTSVELSVGGAVARLVGSRRAFSHVDAALDSLTHLAAPPHKHEIEPEDFEEWCAAVARGWSGASEACAAAGLLRSHVAHRIATVLLADFGEKVIDSLLDDLTSWLRERTFATFAQMSEAADTGRCEETPTPRPVDVDHTCSVIMDELEYLQMLFGSERLSASVRLCVRSLSHGAVTRDVCFRALDALALRFKAAAALRHPSFDSN